MCYIIIKAFLKQSLSILGCCESLQHNITGNVDPIHAVYPRLTREGGIKMNTKIKEMISCLPNYDLTIRYRVNC